MDQVRFLGKQHAVEELLAIGDLFILPSENESFGLAALEAMACEIPVISTNIGGLPEVNIQGVTGYLCELGDIDDMAAKSLEIISDEANHQKFRAAAVAHAKTFDINAIVPKYEQYYEKIIAKVMG
jgi:L-malate glycosyltransferase